MGQAVHILKRNHLPGQHAQGPARVTLRRLATCERDQMRLLLTVKFPGIGSRLDAAGSQGNVHSLLHKPLADTLHRRETDKKRLTDPPVCPSGISFEQYVRHRIFLAECSPVLTISFSSSRSSSV